MISVLDRYIGRTIFGSIMTTLFMLVSLSGIIKFVDQLRKVGHGNYDVFGAALYTLLSVPKDIEIFFPMTVLLGTLLGLGALATRSELVAMEAAGYTRLKIASSVMKTAIPLVLLTMAIGEWVSPLGEQTAREMRAQKMYGGSLLSTRSGLWAKDNNDFIYVENVNNNNELVNINIYHFDEKSKLQYIRSAALGIFDTEKGVWQLNQVSDTDLSNIKEITVQNFVSRNWQTSLTPDKLGVVALNPESLSISGLYDYINYLQSSGQEANRYELIFWTKCLVPLSVTVMMLMALSFVFGPLRSVPMGLRLVTGISFGFLFYVLDKIFGPLSLVYNIPPLLGALLPSLLFLLISLYLLQNRR